MWILLLIFALPYCAYGDEHGIICSPARNDLPDLNGCAVTVTGDVGAEFMFMDISGSESFTIPAEGSLTIDLETAYQGTAGVDNVGAFIFSDSDLSVVVERVDILVDGRYIDAYQVKPEGGTRFVVAGYEASSDVDENVGSFLQILSYDGSNQVTVYKDGSVEQQVTLFRFEVLTILAEDDDEDFSGYTVESTFPVSVISGNLNAVNSATEQSQFGTYVTSLPPSNQLATEYVTPPIDGRIDSEGGYTIRVYANEGGTSATIGGSNYGPIAEGQYVSVDTESYNTGLIVTCDQPCMTVIFSKYYLQDMGYFMFDAVPVTSHYSSTVFTTLSTEEQHYISIVGEGPSGDGINLDGNPITGVSWQTVGSYFYGSLEVTSGTHTLDSASLTFSTYVYSHTGFFGGYGYGIRIAGEGSTPASTIPPESTTPGPTTTRDPDAVDLEFGIICSMARNDFPEYNGCSVTVAGETGTTVTVEDSDGVTVEIIPASGELKIDLGIDYQGTGGVETRGLYVTADSSVQVAVEKVDLLGVDRYIDVYDAKPAGVGANLYVVAGFDAGSPDENNIKSFYQLLAYEDGTQVTVELDGQQQDQFILNRAYETDESESPQWHYHHIYFPSISNIWQP